MTSYTSFTRHQVSWRAFDTDMEEGASLSEARAMPKVPLIS